VSKQYRTILILLSLVLIIGFDQVTKVVVRQKVEFSENIKIIDNIVTLTKAENTGAFLSMGDNLPRWIYSVVMIIIPLIVLLYAMYYLIKNRELSKLLTIALCLIIGGGIGNIIDRIIFGSVTDFLYFNFGLFHTGIVNIADISLTTGFFILLFEYFILNRKKESSST
jgi:signal peptidase II